MQTMMAVVKHGEPIRPLGGGGARLPEAAAMPLTSNGLYEGSTRWW